MNELAFVEKREPDWKRLTALCDLADNSPAVLTSRDFQEFVRLYRRVSSDLATVRTRSGNEQLTFFLNELVGKAYGILYRTPRGSFLSAIKNAIDLAAQTVRRRKYFVLASASIFILSGGFTFAVMSFKPETHDFFIPPEQKPLYDAWKKGTFDDGQAHNAATSTFMTSFYMSNNPRVAIISGSVGAATFGLLPLYLLFQNGAEIGSLAHELAPLGLDGHLFVSITPHGVTEISGLIISAAAGMVFGWALICPGRRSRGEALLEEGRDAVVLLGTSVVLMFMAAPIEGFFSFNPAVPNWARILVASSSAVAWGLFWTFAGRDTEPAPTLTRSEA